MTTIGRETPRMFANDRESSNEDIKPLEETESQDDQTGDGAVSRQNRLAERKRKRKKIYSQH